MPANHGAWLTAPGASLDIRPVTVLDPDLHQILIKSHAVAVNPVDWGMQMMGPERFPFIKCPCVLGHDVAGEVVAVGSAVTRFKVGDRVLGLAAGPKLNSQGQLGAFQEYTLLADNMSSPIPDGISYEEASVVPLGLSTSACGMFEKDYLALPRPSVNPTPLGKTLLVWSGASSVGSNAVQLGVAAGCDVITTCSPKNYALVKKLGASQVFDYNSETVVSDILSYLEGKVIAGALAIGNANAIRAGHGQNATKMVLEIVSRAQGNKFVALGFPYDGEIPEGVESKYIIGNSMAQNDLGAAVVANYLPRALAEGKFIPAPEPLVAGRGLESLETAFGIVRDGVSARKVVVSLE